MRNTDGTNYGATY